MTGRGSAKPGGLLRGDEEYIYGFSSLLMWSESKLRCVPIIGCRQHYKDGSWNLVNLSPSLVGAGTGRREKGGAEG
jgi:hypothetical protein